MSFGINKQYYMSNHFSPGPPIEKFLVTLSGHVIEIKPDDNHHVIVEAGNENNRVIESHHIKPGEKSAKFTRLKSDQTYKFRTTKIRYLPGVIDRIVEAILYLITWPIRATWRRVSNRFCDT